MEEDKILIEKRKINIDLPVSMVILFLQIVTGFFTFFSFTPLIGEARTNSSTPYLFLIMVVLVLYGARIMLRNKVISILVLFLLNLTIIIAVSSYYFNYF